MTVLFGTLGWRPESLIPSIKSTKDLEKLYFYHSDHKDSMKARNKVVEYCRTIGLVAEPIELRKPFNLIDIATRMKEDIERVSAEGDVMIRFNIAGGTRLMSSAALLVCILKGIPTTYVHDDTFEEIQLPLLQMNYSEAFTGKQKEVLKALRRIGRPIKQTELAKEIGIHKATLNHHIKMLKERGAIELENDKKDGRASMITLAPHIHLLLE